MNRRIFLKNTALTAGLVTLRPRDLFPGSLTSADYFGLHALIEDNPYAVFVFKTNISSIGDAADILKVGKDLGNSIFVPKTSLAEGFPVNSVVPLKPNLNQRFNEGESSIGVQTDVNFTEGIISSLTRSDIGISPGNIHIRETHTQNLNNYTGYDEMVARTGVNMNLFTDFTIDQFTGSYEDELNWMDLENGEFFKRIPYFQPFGTPGSYLINLAKYKSHWIGITGCAKNLQGLMVKGYVRHCTPIGLQMNNVNTDDINMDSAYNTIMNRYKSRKEAGMPRYDKAYESDEEAASDWAGPVRVETWMSRCLDNHSILKPEINILEGIYSREGAVDNNPNQPADFTQPMTNIILFGKNPFAVDVIATYLAGHEPGNFAWLHTAFEREISPLNPLEIPLYEWSLDGTATEKNLSDFDRYNLRSKYIPQESEEAWHMVDQDFDYSNYEFEFPAEPTSLTNKNMPEMGVLRQNYPNPFRSATTIKYNIPERGNFKIDVIDMHGRVVDVLKEGNSSKGTYLVSWNATGKPDGFYFCRLRFKGHENIIKMQVKR